VIKISELAVIGDNEFLMGFELIGIKKTFEGETKEKLREHFVSALNDRNVGVVVTNDKSLDRLEQTFRKTVENSISPVVVVLSTKAGAQDNLRDLIKKSIGIDLWSK
jgi:V/A-type H+/Na+-transporting ATPase subunit F